MRMFAGTLAASLFVVALGAQSSPGLTTWGAHDYVEYVEGNLPLVISSGHGGALRPNEISDRTYGVTVQDGETQPLTRELVREIVRLTGRMPHVVYSHLHRIKLDPNREIVEAAQGDPIAEQAWRDYERFLDIATARVTSQWGRGLYVDVHGHGHTLQRIEWGYALTASDLALADPVLGQQTYIDRSTIRNLANDPNVAFLEVLRGTTSFGGMLEGRGYPGVPSPAIPDPAGATYFSGGYNVQRHGSRDGGTVDAVQIELPSSLRFDVPVRRVLVQRFAESIVAFLQTHYGIDMAVDPRISVTASTPFTTESGAPAAFRLTRTGDVSQPASALLVVGGTATAGVDYQPIAPLVGFAAQQSTVDIPVVPIADALDEGSETVDVTIRGGIDVGQPNHATIVVDDDGIDPSLVAHWTLDEVVSSAVQDVSGNGHSASVQPSASGGPQSVASPRFGGLDFDGVDDRVTAADFAYAPAGEFTLAFWFRVSPASGSGYQYMVSHGAVGAANSLNIWFVESDAELRTALAFANDRAPTGHLDVPDDFMDGAWHHYALVARPLGLTLVVVDGEVRAEAAFSGDSYDPSGPLWLGARSDLSSSRFYGGALDDVRIWRRALDLAEVRMLVARLPGRFDRYGAGCAGSGGVPTIYGSGAPSVNRDLEIELSNGPAASAAILAIGTSRTMWSGGVLPLPLDVLGASGCALLQDLTITLPAATDAAGEASIRVSVPPTPALVRSTAFAQFILLDAGANPLGLTASDGLMVLLGG